MKECTRSKGKNKQSTRRGKAEKRDEDVSKKTPWPVTTGPTPGPSSSVTKQPTMRKNEVLNYTAEKTWNLLFILLRF
jgi:hypothetical protein